MNIELLSSLACRFHVGKAGDSEAEWFLRECWHWLYSSFPEHRRDIRLVLGGVLLDFRSKPTPATRISPILELLGQITKGFQTPLLDVHRGLFTHILLPLHEPNQMAEWRDQLPILAEYHEPLVYAIAIILDKEPSLAPEAVQSILSFWPEGLDSNSAKEVLLLHELETLTHYVNADAFESLVLDIVLRVTKCLATKNSRLVERALYLWKDESFLGLLESQVKTVMKPIVSTLYREGKLFWNPTVNKMTAAVLETMEKMDESLFAQASEEIMKEYSNSSRSSSTLDGGGELKREKLVSDNNEGRRQSEERHSSKAPTTGSFMAAGPSSSLSASKVGTTSGLQSSPMVGCNMGSRISYGLTQHGIAALRTAKEAAAASTAKTKNPPVTITGVAPWAFPQARYPRYPTRVQHPNRGQATNEYNNPHKKQARLEKSDLIGGQQAGMKLLPPRGDEQVHTDAVQDDSPPLEKRSIQKEATVSSSSVKALNGGLKQMKMFIERLRPASAHDDNEEGSWHSEQMRPDVTLFPDLKFHNLVFGGDLGCGSFSRVCYARQIKRELPRSKWPEYAIKIMDMELLETMNYKVNASTEIAILSALNHPGIARLVSSFQWKGGVYLVLEYAERGDLQQLIAQYGSLNESSTRWIVSEIIDTICYIHTIGFVYSDLKPENVLITHSGHIKLTDFGAARPATEQGRDVLYRSYRTLKKLRSGGWRSTVESAGVNEPPSQNNIDDGGGDICKYDDEEDERSACAELLQRVEGTAVYLPPEVAKGGGRPGFPADAWALGCLMLQCLSGRPPILGDVSGDDRATLSHVVRFATDEEQGLKKALSRLPEEVSLLARCLATSLLHTDPSPGKRISVENAANDLWFANANLNVHNMYADSSPVKLLAGPVAPQANAAWTRRQNSMIWAPMPEPFELQGERKSALGVITENEIERCGSFVKFGNRSHRGMGLPPLPESRPTRNIF